MELATFVLPASIVADFVRLIEGGLQLPQPYLLKALPLDPMPDRFAFHLVCYCLVATAAPNVVAAFILLRQHT